MTICLVAIKLQQRRYGPVLPSVWRPCPAPEARDGSGRQRQGGPIEHDQPPAESSRSVPRTSQILQRAQARVLLAKSPDPEAHIPRPQLPMEDVLFRALPTP